MVTNFGGRFWGYVRDDEAFRRWKGIKVEMCFRTFVATSQIIRIDALGQHGGKMSYFRPRAGVEGAERSTEISHAEVPSYAVEKAQCGKKSRFTHDFNASINLFTEALTGFTSQGSTASN